MKFFIIFIFFFLTACSLKSNEKGKTSGIDGNRLVIQAGLDPNADSDGDFVKNADELSLGRNPMVADLPELALNFLQNYKITADAKNIATGEILKISIDTKIGRNNPNFKYRVGELFAHDNAVRAAASLGRFSAHTFGEIDAHDLSWVKYPDVDPAFYSEQVLKYKRYFDSPDFEITNLKITLENTMMLKANGHYRTIKELKLNFYFYNYETQNYEVLAAKVVSRHFEAGVVETFEVELDNLPSLLISDNYFTKGEFIISEVADYEIPEMNTTYQTLARSVKEKCVPVIVTTPLETHISYVGVDDGEKAHATFSSILSRLYKAGVKIEDDSLTQIGEWRSNLPDFTYLKEVAAFEKVGKWFIFTKHLNTGVLDHNFTQKDVIILSYVTGKDLSTQSAEKIYSFGPNLTTNDSFVLFPLGESGANSVLEFQIAPLKRSGEEFANFKETWSSPGGACGRNCIINEFTCEISINLFKPIEPSFPLSPDAPEFKRMFLIVDQDEFSLEQLLKDKKIEVKGINGNLHIKIPDIGKIKELAPTVASNLALKMMALKDTTFHGDKLMSFSGRDRGYCLPMLTAHAAHFGFPVSVESAEFAAWRGGVNWDVVKLGENKTYFQGMEVAVTSVINNYFN